MIKRMIAVFLTTVLTLSAGWLQAAELRLGRYYGDNMVLQRDKVNRVRGFAEAGASVTVTFANQEKIAKVDASGEWSITLDPLTANKTAQTLTVTAGKAKVSLSNVLVGDVFLLARQTSIDISLGKNEQGKAVATAHKVNPLLRAISIKTLPARSPMPDLAAEATRGWSDVNTDCALAMTASSYYLGRDLAAQSDIPVGIIDLNLGQAFPISWLSREALAETEKFYGKTDVPGLISRFDNLLDLSDKGQPLPRNETLKSNFVEYVLFPSGGYNAVLNPLKGIALKAAMIQLGNDYPYMIYANMEHNGTHLDRGALNNAYVDTYDLRKIGFRLEPFTTPRIPREWRKALGDDSLPMGLIVPPGSDLNTLSQHHREMRELQRLTAESLQGVDAVLPGIANIPFSAQPSDDSLLAKRCLSWIKGAVYRKPDVAPTGPMFDRLDLNFSKATVHFKPGTAKGLCASGNALGFFEVAGVEAEYSPAKAVIDGETIRIMSDTVARIVYVRYNWNGRPDQGLVNSDGLAAMPFRSQKADYHWFVTNKDNDLPIEYHTPANEWAQNDVTLVNGQMETHGYNNFTGWLGPIGIKVGPFGPNMGVREIKVGAPAQGKLFEGDIIYSVNGKMLGAKAWEVMGAAITESETIEANGKMVLGLRRDGKNLDVEVTLEVMGTYSSTSPYDCPKTEKILAKLEKWVVDGGAGAGFLNTDALFMLGTGKPELQGYVRRIVYEILAVKNPNSPIDPLKAGSSWNNSAEAILLGEYFLASGDRNVLPYLKHACARLAVTQNKQEGGWRHYIGGGDDYGLIPNAGLPGVMGMHFAITAGLDIDMDSFNLAIKHFQRNRAETGYLIYGFKGCEREVPEPFEPEKIINGELTTYNGGLSAAGILMRFVGDHRSANRCTMMSAYAWNNTFDGHGGNFWNNFWTPLGAHAHSKSAFIHFWKNYRWYRECNRMFDGSLIQHEDGRVGAGAGLALVAPLHRLQILGAPMSPFAKNAQSELKPALAAYETGDYAGCESLVNALIAGGSIGKKDLPTVEALGLAAKLLRESIVIDLQRMNALVEAGDVTQAHSFLASLEGVMPKDDERLVAIKKLIGVVPAAPKSKLETPKASDSKNNREWICLVTEIATPLSKDGMGKVAPEIANKWRMKIIEDPVQSPAEWTTPDFNDSDWWETNLPLSWRMYHTALLRTKFNVDDVSIIDGLRFRGWLFRQQGIEIYLNGELIGKVNNLEQNTGNVDAEFKNSALKHLRKGENTLAISTRHNWRWGMVLMRVYNDGFGFRLDARKK